MQDHEIQNKDFRKDTPITTASVVLMLMVLVFVGAQIGTTAQALDRQTIETFAWLKVPVILGDDVDGSLSQ